MNPILDLLPLLRLRGVVLEADGDRVVIRRRATALTALELERLQMNRQEVARAILEQARTDPNLSGVANRWMRVTRRTAYEFFFALEATTGCDFDEREPTLEEIRVFDAMLDQLEPLVRSTAPAAIDAHPASGTTSVSTESRRQQPEFAT